MVLHGSGNNIETSLQFLLCGCLEAGDGDTIGTEGRKNFVERIEFLSTQVPDFDAKLV